MPGVRDGGIPFDNGCTSNGLGNYFSHRVVMVLRCQIVCVCIRVWCTRNIEIVRLKINGQPVNSLPSRSGINVSLVE